MSTQGTLCCHPDKSCEKDSSRTGVIEERHTVAPELTSMTKPMPMPISIPSVPTTVDSHFSTSNDPPPSYAYPEDDRERVVSPYLDSSSNSSGESSPPSPCLKTPSKNGSSALSALGGKTVHFDPIDPLDIEMKHDGIRIHYERECT